MKKNDHIYRKNLRNRLLGLAKAPISDDRKPVRVALIWTKLRSLCSSILGSFRSSRKTNFSGSFGMTATKRSFLLPEVLLAIAVLVLFIPLIVRLPIEYYRSQVERLEAFERQRIADWTFSEIKEFFLKESIPWEELPGKKHEITRFLSDANFLMPNFSVRPIHRQFSLKCTGEKHGPHGEIFRLYETTIFLGSNKYKYRILMQRLPNDAK